MKFPFRFLTALIVALLCVGLTAPASAVQAKVGQGRPVKTQPAIYWGATIGSQLTGNQAPWDTTAIDKFEGLAQKRLSLVQFFQPFANCNPTCSFYGFPTTPLNNVRAHGAIPVLSWSSQSIPSSKSEPDFQLADVASGTYDTYIRNFATAARGWGHPFFLRFNWEANGNWFPWSESINGNQPGDYIRAWRHVHDIFTQVGATNVSWVWCPNIDPGGVYQNLASIYPGSTYVDWTCIDGYNRGGSGWATFSSLYRSTYNAVLALAPGKPLMIGEVASSENGGSKATWIKDMLARVPTEYPSIRALLWFDKYDSGMDWPIETSAAATAGFAAGIANPAYVVNNYGAISASPIPAPTR